MNYTLSRNRISPGIPVSSNLRDARGNRTVRHCPNVKASKYNECQGPMRLLLIFLALMAGVPHKAFASVFDVIVQLDGTVKLEETPIAIRLESEIDPASIARQLAQSNLVLKTITIDGADSDYLMYSIQKGGRSILEFSVSEGKVSSIKTGQGRWRFALMESGMNLDEASNLNTIKCEQYESIYCSVDQRSNVAFRLNFEECTDEQFENIDQSLQQSDWAPEFRNTKFECVNLGELVQPQGTEFY